MATVHQQVHFTEKLLQEMERQDQLHPDGYPATRDGVYLGIMTAKNEELREARKAWRRARCKCETPRCDHHDWTEVAEELIQAAAVIMRTVRSIEMRAAEQ